MLPLVCSSSMISPVTEKKTEQTQTKWTKKGELLEVVKAVIKNYETAYQATTFEEFFEKCLAKSRHKTKGPLLDRLSRKILATYNEELINNLQRDSEALWTLYQNGLKSGLLESTDQPNLLILGPKQLRVSQEFTRNFGVLNDQNGRTGCIFGGKWSLLRNDLMVLSAVHAHKAVMFFLPQGLTQTQLKKDNQPTILCREISILLAAGYQRVKNPYESLVGYTLTQTDSAKANAFNLNDLINSCQSINPEWVESQFIRSLA